MARWQNTHVLALCAYVAKTHFRQKNPKVEQSAHFLRLQPAMVPYELDCVHFSKIFFSRNFSKKIIFSKKKIEIHFFYTFGILTTKMYTKLASIEIND
jgi:hypothetical protein